MELRIGLLGRRATDEDDLRHSKVVSGHEVARSCGNRSRHRERYLATQAHLFGVVRVDRDATGVLSIVNREGSAICLAEDQTGSELCGSVLQQPGSGSLSVGQRVAVTIIWISQTSGASQALVITSPHPGP